MHHAERLHVVMREIPPLIIRGAVDLARRGHAVHVDVGGGAVADEVGGVAAQVVVVDGHFRLGELVVFFAAGVTDGPRRQAAARATADRGAALKVGDVERSAAVAGTPSSTDGTKQVAVRGAADGAAVAVQPTGRGAGAAEGHYGTWLEHVRIAFRNRGAVPQVAAGAAE